jgi:hypothetical protein
MLRRIRHALVAIGLLATGSALAPNGSHLLAAESGGRADEYRVKAAFLYNFVKFVEWPAAAFNTASAPLTLCVLGADPFGSVLEETLNTRMVGGRPVVARRIADVEPGCHLLFISGSERKRMAVIADQVRTSSVLTVSEEQGFSGLGGMIELFTDGESVQFNIYPSVVEASGLHASARLIALAANQKHQSGGRR